MRTLTRLTCITLIAGLPALVAAQAPVVVNLATIAPQNSAWADALGELGQAWKTATKGRVTLFLYAGGSRGTESSYIKLMRFNDLQAALLLPPGLSEIDDAFNVLGIPFFFDSDAEVAAVLEALTPTLSARLEAKRFHLIGWGHAGWVQVFSKRPIQAVADMQKGRLYTTEGNDAVVRCYERAGFAPAPKTFNDIPGALKSFTGGLDIVPAPPLAAKTMFFRDAPNMLDLRVAPLISAIVMNDRTWNRISEEDRRAILEAAAEMTANVMAGAPGLDRESIDEMQERGLTVTTLDTDAREEFLSVAAEVNDCMRGPVVPTDVYDEALRARDAYRKGGRF